MEKILLATTNIYKKFQSEYHNSNHLFYILRKSSVTILTNNFSFKRESRTKEHPRTPPMYQKYSRRGWDGMVKLRRKQLHAWDPKEDGKIDNES